MLREVKVENGIVKGLPAADPRITSFKGIPFAAPPVGENRWRAPQPAKDWNGVLKAFEFAPISMQAKTVIDENNIYTREWNVDPDIPMDEDCLYLNVWTPSCSGNEKLPVFVWYFGGALQFGNTAEMEFDGERIARRGVVVVTVNYRLNVFGFLCHPEITAEAPGAPANFGNLDQQAGTQWVKRNIAAFGGDPNNITIGGQSAGGGSVLSQLTSK
jgi:para-nitrobenzyl esterase